MDGGAWWATVHRVAESRTQLSEFTFTFHSYALEKEMATHSSVLALRIPGTGEPGGLLSMGLHRVGHDWSDLAAATAAETFLVVTTYGPRGDATDISYADARNVLNIPQCTWQHATTKNHLVKNVSSATVGRLKLTKGRLCYIIFPCGCQKWSVTSFRIVPVAITQLAPLGF